MSSGKAPVIAIDGPAGAGKSTVAKRLAKELGLRYLDTGAMYRALALKVQQEGDPDAACAIAAIVDIRFGPGEPQTVLLEGEDVTEAIRTPEIGKLASSLSTLRDVRSALVARQQEIVRLGGVVLEGRDATTVIAPEATLKIYMTASLEERALRRKREFEAKGTALNIEEVREQIEERDHRDITRTESPLRWTAEAHLVETAGRSVDEVVANIVELFTQIP